MKKTATKSPGITLRKVHKIADLATYSEDSIVSRTLVKSKSGSLTLFAFAAGQHLSEHTCPFDACAHIVDGTAEIVIDGVPFKIGSGQMIVMPANVPHAVNARQGFIMLLTMFKVDDDRRQGDCLQGSGE